MNDFLDDKDREHGQEQQSVEGKMCSAGAEKNSNLGSGISAQRCGFSTSETESVPPGAKRIGRGPLCRKKRKSSNGSLLTMNGRFRTRWHNDTRNTGKCKRKAKNNEGNMLNDGHGVGSRTSMAAPNISSDDMCV